MIDRFECHDIDSKVSNVVSIRSRLSVANRDYLSRWLKSGRVLGLLDAEATQDKNGRGNVQVLVWVREAADAAYRVHANGTGWTVMDNLRDNELGRHASFELALESIRPVFTYSVTQPRKRGSRLAQRSKAALTALDNWTAAARI